MLGQGGLPTEAARTGQGGQCLWLAVGFGLHLTARRRTSVRPAAGVDPTMSGQAGRLCITVSIALTWARKETHVREAFPTTFMLAAMRLLAGMSTYVDCESAALDEAFVAVAPGANVGTVIGMDAKVPDEVGFAIELLQGCGEQVSTRTGSVMLWIQED